MTTAELPRKPRAIVFFARDFLSTEFPKLSGVLGEYVRVYITANRHEAERVKKSDLEGVVFPLDDVDRWRDAHHEIAGMAYNSDRFLRRYARREIEEVYRVLCGISRECLGKFSVEFYIDEPVSGFPNWYFNSTFSAAGAQCLHFQTSWVPGYMFFTADAAQASPVNVGWNAEWGEIVKTHIESRSKGLAKPVYVINYGSRRKRLQDAVITTAKGVYRTLFRRRDFYIDRDASAHWLHAECLRRSFDGGIYSEPPAGGDGNRYVLIPLHYEPESVLNYFSEFQRQEEIASQILDTMPLNFRLILKEHPSQPGALGLAKWRSLVGSKRVLALRGDFDARSLLKLDVVVVSIGSTLALESVIAGRPVGVLGAVHFASMPGMRRLHSPKDWLTLLEHSPAQLSEISDWYESFMNSYCFPCNIMRNQTDIQTLGQCLKIFIGHRSP